MYPRVPALQQHLRKNQKVLKKHKEPAQGQDNHSPQWQASCWWDRLIWGSLVCYKASCTQKWLRQWHAALASPLSNVRSDSSAAGHPWRPGRSWMCSVLSHVYLEPPLGWWPLHNTLRKKVKKKSSSTLQVFGIKPRNRRTVGVMLLGVLSFIDLAGGVVAFTNAASVWSSCRPQNTVATHPLRKTKKVIHKKQLAVLFTGQSQALPHIVHQYRH